VWLWRTGRPVWFALLPAMFMVTTSGTALVFNFRKFLADYEVKPLNSTVANMCIAAVLFMLGAFVVVEAVRVWTKSRKGPGFPVVPA
jgi:carbon starvation protein